MAVDADGGRDAGVVPVPLAEGVAPGTEFTWALDAYESAVGFAVPLDGRAVPDGGALRERDIYRALFRESLHPRTFRLELLLYPLPAGAAALKKHRPDLVDDWHVGALDGNDLNIIEGLTAGYQEPWAVSAFVGGEMHFSRAGDAARRSNRGEMGYRLAGGRKHLRANVLIDDTWWEAEWRLSGEREFRDEKLRWNFRAGTRNHGHRDIRDVVLFGFRRSDLDFRVIRADFLRNWSVEALTELARDDGEFLRQELVLGKTYPIRRWRIAAGIELGVVLEKDAKYVGTLANPAVDELTFILRPNLDW